MDIKPIETHYNGYRFRSRLEARWAVFFDAAGIKYVYEPEGFEAHVDEEIRHNCWWRDESDTIKYLPDFYLPNYGYYVEVKPSLTNLLKDQRKLSYMVSRRGPFAKGLLVLGQIPVFNDDNVLPKFALFCADDGNCDYGINCLLAAFVARLYRSDQRYEIRIITEKYSYTEVPHLSVFDDDFEKLYINEKTIWKYDDGLWWNIDEREIKNTALIINRCFDKARKARFEYGETPTVKGG